MERIIEILEGIKSGIDFRNTEGLITNGILDSIEVTDIISELEDEFEIEIDMEYIKPEYFDSAEKIWEMVQELE